MAEVLHLASPPARVGMGLAVPWADPPPNIGMRGVWRNSSALARVIADLVVENLDLSALIVSVLPKSYPAGHSEKVAQRIQPGTSRTLSEKHTTRPKLPVL